MKKVLFVLAAIMALNACEDDKKETEAATDVVDAVDTQSATDAAPAVDASVEVSAAVDATSVEQ